MILSTRTALLFTCLLTFCSSLYANLNAGSAWSNQSGSTLYIDNIDSSGLLSGRYINRAQGYRCYDIAYPVTGWIQGNAITFTTLWESTTESCDSITTWAGFYWEGKITTTWQLVRNSTDSPSKILNGQSVFMAMEQQ